MKKLNKYPSPDYYEKIRARATAEYDKVFAKYIDFKPYPTSGGVMHDVEDFKRYLDILKFIEDGEYPKAVKVYYGSDLTFQEILPIWVLKFIEKYDDLF